MECKRFPCKNGVKVRTGVFAAKKSGWQLIRKIKREGCKRFLRKNGVKIRTEVSPAKKESEIHEGGGGVQGSLLQRKDQKYVLFVRTNI